MKSADSTIINTLRILARDIESEDGVANAALQEAAERFCELLRYKNCTEELVITQERLEKLECKITRTRGLMMVAAQRLEAWNRYAFECETVCKRVDELIAELRKEAQG